MSVKWEPNGVYFNNNSNSLYKTTSENFTPTYNTYQGGYIYETTVTTAYDIGMMVLRTYNCTGDYNSGSYFKINFNYGTWVIAIRYPYRYEYEDEETGETVYEEGYKITGTYLPGQALAASYDGYGYYVNFKTSMPFRVFAWRIE